MAVTLSHNNNKKNFLGEGHQDFGTYPKCVGPQLDRTCWSEDPDWKILVPFLLFVYFLSKAIFYPRSTRHIKFWFLDTHASYLSKILTARRKIVGTSGEWAPIRQQPCCVNLFSKYLVYELLNSPVSWQDFSCIHIFSFPRFWTFYTECFAFYHFDCVTVKTNNWFSFINLTST